VTAGDFHRFDHIVALDRQNLAALQHLRPPGATAELSLLLDHVDGREGEAVADPYYGQDSHFEETWRDVVEGARALADRIERE
jgi:protein-tyrosine phosphatase